MDSSRFIICRAAAGSGKTYTLVRQYLQLAFSAPEHELKRRFARILAITFTNKAANEMKERILRELDNIADLGTSTGMGSDLGKLMGLDDARLRHYATTVRSAILHNYSDFAVCTIDSFVHRLVRTFAHDLNLPMNFDVYIDNTELIQNAVDNLMALAGTDGNEELTEVLCEFAESRMDEGKNYVIEGDLAKLAEELFKENTPEFLHDLSNLDTAQFRQISRDMREANHEYQQQMRALSQEGVTAIAEAGLEAKDFHQGDRGVYGYFRKLTDGSLDTPNSYALAYLDGDKTGKHPGASAVKPTLQDIHQRIEVLRQNEEKAYNTRRQLLKNMYSLALINKLNELVATFSHENEVLHLSEFNKRINAVVQDEPTPFIYERIGNRYYNYLIDEFQDTSRLQWQNLVPLLENGVGDGHTSLVVGDGKQAIYRFRQGEVEQFVRLPKVDNAVHGRLLESPEMSAVDRLERNFRSARMVVEFNNQFFEWAIPNRFANNKALQDIYIGQSETPDLRQQPTKEGGYVQVGFWNLDNGHETLWQEMLHDVRSQIADHGYRYKDMTILARNKQTLSEISTYMTEHGIPVVSSESFLLTQSRVVMLIHSLLQYLIDGTNRVAAERVMQYLHQMGRIQTLRHNHYLEARQTIDLDSVLAAEGLDLNCDQLRHLGLYDCIEDAIRMLQLNGIETAYTATLLNVAAKYSSTHREDLPEFLEWFEQQKDRLSTSTANDLDAIQLMTIHKAKGLESPIVLYPVLKKREPQDSIWVHIDPKEGLPLPASLVPLTKDSGTIFDEQFAEEFQKQEMDRVNVLYVALTRPKDKLMIYCQQPDKESSTQYVSLLHDFMAQRTDTQEIRPNVMGLGQNANRQSKEEPSAANETVTLDEVAFPRWDDRIAIAEQSSKVFGECDEESIRRGNMIHNLLSLISSADDLETAMDQTIHTTPIDDTEAQMLKDTIGNMMQQKDIQPFFDPAHTCKNECSLVSNGEILRPDRIVFTPHETWVVDFKTGAPNTEHHAQVSHYCDVIGSMGYPQVKGYLIYIGETHCHLVQV